MKRINTATFPLIAMILLAVAVPIWLIPYISQAREYGITLKFEGTKPFIESKEVCKDVVGNVIISFGNEFHSIDVCELIEKKEVRISFSEGVKYWMKTLEELGIRPGMSAEKVLAILRDRGYGGVAMPTVSITFWLIGEDLHYIANYALTSLDYYYYMRGYDYFQAFNKMLEDPLAIVKERGTIMIRPEELVRNLVPINMTRAIEGVRRELGIEKTLGESAITPETGGCPPGTEPIDRDGVVCKWKNYWGFPDTPPEWFYNRTIVGSNKEYVVGRLWEGFKEWFSTAYLFSKSSYSSEAAVWYSLIRIWSNDCFRSYQRGTYIWKNLGKPLSMSYVLKYCIDPDVDPRSINWNHTLTPGSFFTVLKPFVMKFYVDPSIGGLPPIEVLLNYGVAAAGFKRTGFSIMGAMINSDEGYNIQISQRSITMSPYAWDVYGSRIAALIVPAQYKYLYDALIFNWHVRSYSSTYWIAEPIPIITPYYKEVSTYSIDYWGLCHYDGSGNYVFGCDNPLYHRNINEIIEEVTGAFYTDYHTIESIKFNDIPMTYTILDISNATEGSCSQSLGAVVFSVVKSLASTLFGLFPETAPLGMLLSLVDYTDTTFNATAVSLHIEWVRGGTSSDSIYVDVSKVTKTEYTLSRCYNQVGKKPLAAAYVFHFYIPGGGPPPCPLPMGEPES